MKILVGQGCKVMRDSLESLFATMNQQVEFATVGDFDDALSRARVESFALIVLDRELPGFTRERLTEFNGLTAAPVLFSAESPTGEPAAFATLTRRERDVLDLVADGQSNKQIARVLDLQEVTVKAHLRQVFRKLDVANRTQAATMVLSHRRQLV